MLFTFFRSEVVSWAPVTMAPTKLTARGFAARIIIAFVPFDPRSFHIYFRAKERLLAVYSWRGQGGGLPCPQLYGQLHADRKETPFFLHKAKGF